MKKPRRTIYDILDKDGDLRGTEYTAKEARTEKTYWDLHAPDFKPHRIYKYQLVGPVS